MKKKPTRRPRTFYSVIKPAPELMLGDVLAQLARVDPEAYATFEHGRPLAELAVYLPAKSHTQHANYVRRVKDADAVWAWAHKFIALQNREARA